MCSNFHCEICNKAIIDAPYMGYVTECEHYPISKKTKQLKDDMMMEEAISSAELAED